MGTKRPEISSFLAVLEAGLNSFGIYYVGPRDCEHFTASGRTDPHALRNR